MTTVRSLLFGDLIPGQAGSTAQRVVESAERLAASGVLPAGGDAPLAVIARSVLAKVSETLDFEISDVLFGAWRTRSALLTAARETYAAPGTSRQVSIKTYTLPWDYETDLDVVVNGSTILTLTLAVSLELEVTALGATVQAGKLTKLTSGDAKVSGSLQLTAASAPLAQTVPLAQGERTFDLRYELKIGAGIPLIDEAREPQPSTDPVA